MRDIVKEYQKKFRRNHQRARRYTALLLALALTTSLFVNWQLHGVGIAKTAEYLCGELEHEHTAACYEKQLVCGYEEGEPEDWNATMTDDGTSFDDTFGMDADDPGIAAYSAEPEYIFVPHEHTDDCYQEVRELTCLEEEHEHTDDCFDPEDGSLICGLFCHTHDDSCYTTTYELVCGLEEGELVEEVNPDYDPVALFEEPVAAKARGGRSCDRDPGAPPHRCLLRGSAGLRPAGASPHGELPVRPAGRHAGRGRLAGQDWHGPDRHVERRPAHRGTGSTGL